MPINALLVIIAVVAIFVTFAAALASADRQTNADQLDSDTQRRSS